MKLNHRTGNEVHSGIYIQIRYSVFFYSEYVIFYYLCSHICIQSFTLSSISTDTDFCSFPDGYILSFIDIYDLIFQYEWGHKQ